MDYLSKSQSSYRYFLKAVAIEEVLEHPFLDLIAKVNDFMNGFDLLELLFLHQELTGNTYWKIEKDGMKVPTEIWPLYPQFIKIITHRQKFISGYEFSIDNNIKIK